MKNSIILAVTLLIICTSVCFAKPNSNITFTGFVITEFQAIQTVYGQENIDLPASRDSKLLETVFGSMCENCWVYGSPQDDSGEVLSCEFVKRKLRAKARFSSDIDTMVLWIGSHGFVRDGELNILFQDSQIRVENGEITSASNTLSGTELADIILQFQCEKLVLVLDCCYSGHAGYLAQLADRIDEDNRGPRSIAILSSSSGHATSQVFLKRCVSLYTEFVLAALVGMGDKNRDNKVSVEEIHDYASALVSMYSEIQEREFGSFIDPFATKNAVKVETSGVQCPELKKIVKGRNAAIEFEIPQMPYDVSMGFLTQHINDMAKLHNLDPEKLRVDDFIQRDFPLNQQANRGFGRDIACRIQKAITPNAIFTKSIADRPITKNAKAYQYAVQGTYQPMMDRNTGMIIISVDCRIVNLSTDLVLSSASIIINDLAEVASKVLPGAENPTSVRVSLERRSNGKRVPVTRYPGGQANDYAVHEGDRLLITMENLTDEPIAVMLFVDGLNAVLRAGEKDVDRVASTADHIKKKHYLIIPAKATRFCNGWTLVNHREGVSELNYNHFVVCDAPNSLRERLAVDPEKTESPLGEIRLLAFKTVKVSKTDRSATAAMTIGDEVHQSNVKNSAFKIPSSTAEPLETVVLHYAFPPSNDSE